MEFRNGSKTVRKTLRAQVQQCLNEDIDFQWIVRHFDHFIVILWIW